MPKVICPSCERDIFFLERIPLPGEPFVFYITSALGDKIAFGATHNTSCPLCRAKVMIPWQGRGFKVLTNKGIVPEIIK